MLTSYPAPSTPRPSAPDLEAVKRQVPLALLTLEPLHGTTSNGGHGAWLAESLLKRLESKGYDRGACEWALYVMTRDEDESAFGPLLAVRDELPSQPLFPSGGRPLRSHCRPMLPTLPALPRLNYVWPLPALWRWHEQQVAVAAKDDSAQETHVFRLETEVFYVAFGCQRGRYKADKGFHRIQRLLQSPCHAVSALALAGSDDEECRVTFTETDPHDRDQDEARRLVERIRDAKENLEPDEEERLQAQLDNLATRTKERPARRVKARRSGPAVDAENAVWKSVRRALNDMRANLPELVKHLEDCIQVHELASLIYRPSSPPAWKF